MKKLLLLILLAGCTNQNDIDKIDKAMSVLTFSTASIVCTTENMEKFKKYIDDIREIKNEEIAVLLFDGLILRCIQQKVENDEIRVLKGKVQ